MTSTLKAVLIVLGSVTAIAIAGQLVLGQLILGGRADLVKAHQHSGYTAVVLALAYVAVSLRAILAVPTRRADSSAQG